MSQRGFRPTSISIKRKTRDHISWTHIHDSVNAGKVSQWVFKFVTLSKHPRYPRGTNKRPWVPLTEASGWGRRCLMVFIISLSCPWYYRRWDRSVFSICEHVSEVGEFGTTPIWIADRHYYSIHVTIEPQSNWKQQTYRWSETWRWFVEILASLALQSLRWENLEHSSIKNLPPVERVRGWSTEGRSASMLKTAHQSAPKLKLM